METLADNWLSIGMDVVGYLAAGAFAVVVSSMFGARSRAASPAIAPADNPKPVERNPVRTAYVPLGKQASTAAASSDETVVSSTGKQDRREILKVARKLVQTGVSPERIQSLLPVSEAELALMSIGKN